MNTTTTVIQDRFELKERLFSEGNQAAYVARDKRRSEDVLLFLVPPSGKLAENVDRAVRADIERAFAVESPSLLPLLDLCEAGDYRFLVMPMPRGTNAWTRITKEKAARKPIGHEEALRAADDLLAAARAAEAQGTILGFSPKQVWIGADGAAEVQYYWLERVYLDDDEFGLPEQAGIKTMSAEGGYFQAPELSAGRAGAAPPADQFFIGAILYGLLTGEVPGGTLAPIRRSRHDVPKPFAKAVERSLAQDPGDRHADHESFRRALYKEPAKLGHLAPLLLLLAGLWVGFSLFLGGADLDDWAFPAEMEARREAAFLASKRTAEPVPEASEDDLRRYRGTYESGAGGAPEVELRLGGDGAFLLVDRSRDDVERVHGTWWREAGGTTLVLMPVGTDAKRGAPLQARPGDSVLTVRLPSGEHELGKTGWTAAPGEPAAALLALDAPRVGAVTAEGDVTVAGRVAVAQTTVKVQGESVPVVGTRFDTVVKLGEAGEADIVVEATAPDGFRSTVTRRVLLDAAAPEVAATARLAQKDGIWVLLVEGSCKDDTGITSLSVNDEGIQLEPDGSFSFERKGAPALAHAFTEVVAVDKAGRATRTLTWPGVTPTRAAALAAIIQKAKDALDADRTDEAEDVLRDIRARGGLIEDLPPDKVVKLAYGKRAPRITVDPPPEYFPNDGTQTVKLTGKVELFAGGDRLQVGGQDVEVVDGRWATEVQVPKIGRNDVPIQVDRRGKAFSKSEVTVRIAGPDPEWLGDDVTEAQRRASALSDLAIGHENKHGMRFALVPPGAFFRETEDGVRFEVRVREPFYMQVREVTRRTYEQLSGKTLPAVYTTRSGRQLPIQGATRPASGVSRAEAEDFADGISRDGEGRYRLPSEVEWELAARGGNADGKDYWGSDSSQLKAWANYADMSIRKKISSWPLAKLVEGVDDEYPGTWPVGRGKANAFGLRDMLGNAAEWTSTYYAPYDPDDPDGPMGGDTGVARGGSFKQKPDDNCLACREQVPLSESPTHVGFRLVYVPEGR